MPPSPAPAATNGRSLCSYYQVTSSLAQEAADLDLHRRPSQKSSDSTHLMVSFRQNQSSTQPDPQMTQPNGGRGWGHSPTKVDSYSMASAPAQQFIHCSHGQLSQSQPEGHPNPLICEQQSRPNHTRGAHTTHTGDTPRTTNSGDSEDLWALQNFLHKTTLSRPLST